jgi:hypothetical protein
MPNNAGNEELQETIELHRTAIVTIIAEFPAGFPILNPPEILEEGRRGNPQKVFLNTVVCALVGRLVGFCLYNCFGKPQAAV